MEHYKKEYNSLSMEVLVDGETLFTKVDEYISIMPWVIITLFINIKLEISLIQKRK